MSDRSRPKKEKSELEALRQKLTSLEKKLAAQEHSHPPGSVDIGTPPIKVNYRQLIDNTSEGIALVQKGHIVFANRSLCRILGWTEQELTAKPLLDIVHPLDREAAGERLRKIYNGEHTSASYDCRLIAADGSTKWVEARDRPFDQDERLAILFYFRDDTHWKEMERELRCTQFGLDKAAYAVFQISKDGRVKYCNEAAYRALGYSKEELLQLSAKDIDANHEPQDLKRLWDRAQAGETQILRTLHRRKDGTLFPAEVTTGYFEYEGTEYCFAFSRDITDKITADKERALIEAHLRQQQKIEAISTLASGVAHEINNPINIVMNYAELIINRSDANATIVPFATEIINESQRIATIVRNLLAFAREEHENRQPNSMEDIIERTLSLMREVLAKNYIELDVDIEPGLPDVTCQFQQIQQVLMNLLTNSRDALREISKGKERKIRVTAKAIDVDNCRKVLTTIADNGPGVEQEIQERIFDPFFTTKPRDQGTGLGLSVSHGIIKEHDGELTYDSETPNGAAFHIMLPVCEDD